MKALHGFKFRVPCHPVREAMYIRKKRKTEGRRRHKTEARMAEEKGIRRQKRKQEQLQQR